MLRFSRKRSNSVNFPGIIGAEALDNIGGNRLVLDEEATVLVSHVDAPRLSDKNHLPLMRQSRKS
jgi:hypothetical protein